MGENTKLEENKYNLTPKSIKKLKILDWKRLKKITWYNQAMKKTGEWYCHIEGVGSGYYGDSINEFWIGFNKKNNAVDINFSCWEGMGNLKFDKFYEEDENIDKYDIEIQSKALKWINKLIDDGILGV